MRAHGFSLFFWRSISGRKGRIFIAVISVAISVTLVTGMIGITYGVSGKLGEELKAYGANIIVSPRGERYVGHDVLQKISGIDGVQDTAGQIFGSVEFRGRSLEVIGLDFGNIKERGWRLNGKWPGKSGEVLAGSDLKAALGLEIGSKVHFAAEKGSGQQISEGAKELIISGFIERGGAEDSSFIMSLQDAWELTGAVRQYSAVLVRGTPGRLEEIVRAVNNMLPETEARTFRQTAYAEEALLRKIQLLLALVTAVVLCAAVISVASTMGANVLERRDEIGLMMALGATKKQISRFYRTEAALIGLAGGSAGFVSGYLFTQVVSKGAFGSFVPVPFYLFFISLLFGLLISGMAGHLPVRNALKYNAAVILRGE